MFKRILIANRGEIAVRIIRTCRELGIETVAVYSTADEGALHTQLATASICIGGPKPADSYLNMRSILTAAVETGCDAIHPGFGFLSENSKFARLTKQCGMAFIGPDADVIDKMGNKAAARALMTANDVPVVPGSRAPLLTAADAASEAARIGYPVLIKASAGGGGRGMRRVYDPGELAAAFEAARAEAKACFGNDEMYMEKLILHPKHIEFQILADAHGTVVHLGERDCSVQRRNQKLLEESPCAILSDELRTEMGAAAVRAARAAGYENAGTVEFIVDQDGNYYFIEMNTRIQVEHPVTEMVTGLDLIELQLRIAAGEPLGLTQRDICPTGHAIECRICAEDPGNGFAPSPGTVKFLHLPGGYGVRVDTALYSGCTQSPYYDSMAAKLIVQGRTREEAIRRMRRALEETEVHGIKTNLGLQYAILSAAPFVSGDYNTGFLDANPALFDPLEERK